MEIITEIITNRKYLYIWGALLFITCGIIIAAENLFLNYRHGKEIVSFSQPVFTPFRCALEGQR